jgi:serine/threonine protein kinase/WD40 repeat protein
MNVPMGQYDTDHPELASLVEQLTGMLESGDSVNIETLLKEHPEHAEQIQSLIPAMAALMDLATPGTGSDGLLTSDSLNGAGEPRSLGDFRIGREIGRGGMGIVYEAEQISMARRVALKVLPLAGLVDELKIRRFQNEVRAVATLNHPNIVPVYMVGEERGIHYYAMQLIRGRSLSDVISSLRHIRDDGKWIDGSISQIARMSSLDEVAEIADADAIKGPFVGDSRKYRKPQTVETVAKADGSTIPHSSRRQHYRSVAALGIQAATALQHAHEAGIIHRDIKPANLLLDSSSQLYLTDFGLARIQSDVSVTMTGDVIGTLRYMAPEQALAKRVVVDHRADIYSLAATLYELLTLRPAYLAKDRQQLLKQIAFEDPPPVRGIDRNIPVELETIVQKGMSKDVDQRYSSAQELADDLRSHLDNRPIRAKPPTISQTIGKWTRRNPIIVRAAALIAVILLVATLGSYSRIASERERAVQAEHKATETAERNRRLSYLSGIHLAHQIYKTSGDLSRASQWLARSLPGEDEEDLRGFEWFYLWNVCRSDHSVRVLPRVGLVDVAFSPDNRTFATGGSDGMIQIWDRHTLERKGAPWPVAPDPYSQYRSIDVLYSPSGNILAGLFCDGFFQVQGRVVLFDVATGKPWSLAHASPDKVVRIAFKEDGTLVTAESDGHVRFWNASTGQPLGSPKQLAKSGTWQRAAFSSDVRLLAAGAGLQRPAGSGELEPGMGVKVTVYQIETGSIESELEADDSVLGKLQFTGDSRFLINPGNPPFGKAKLVVWNVATRQIVFSPEEKQGLRCYRGAVSISADVVAVGGSNSISFVNPKKGGIVDQWHGVPGIVTDLAVSADGIQLASTGWDGMVRLWDLPLQENPMILKLDTPTTTLLRFSPPGDMLASVHPAGVVLRHSESFQESHSLQGETRPVFSSAGNLLATISADDSTIRFWDYRSGQQVSSPLTLEGHAIGQLAFSKDGERIGCATKSGPVITLELATPGNRKQFDIRSSVDRYRYVAFGVNRHGQDLIAIPETNRTVKLLNLDNGAEQILKGPTTQIYGVAFSPDFQRIVSYGNDIFVWNTTTGETELGIEENTGATLQAAFSPDGTSILTRGFKGNVGLWDVQSGREKMRLLEEFEQTTHSVAFSPDGNRIIAVVNDNALMVWSAPRVDSIAENTSP